MIKFINTSLVRAYNLTNFFYNSTKFFSTSMVVNLANLTKNYNKKSNKVFNYAPWQYKDLELSKNEEEYINLNTIKDFLSSLKKDKNYVLIITMITEDGFKIATKDKIMNINCFYNPLTLKEIVNGKIYDICYSPLLVKIYDHYR